jgi:hypothetical protein
VTGDKPVSSRVSSQKEMPPALHTKPDPKTPQKPRQGPLKGYAKHIDGAIEPASFVVLHVDSKLAVSAPEGVNTTTALEIARQVDPREGRCRKCVMHVFVDRTDGVWRAHTVHVQRPARDV